MMRRCFGIYGLMLASLCVSGCFAATIPAATPRAGIVAARPHTEVLLFGRLMPRRSTSIAGATVAVYEMLPDNRLMPVVDHVVQTQADGTYRVRIRLDGAYQGPLLVRADCEFGYGMVLVSDTQVVGDGLAALPITDATTVQAQVYLTARQEHLWPRDLDAVHIHRFIGEPLANAVLLDTDHEQVSLALARAVTAAAISFDATLRAAPGGLSKHAWKQARMAIHGAYFALAEETYRAADSNAVQAAQRAFDERLAAAQGRQGDVPQAAWTIASQAAWEAFLPYINALPPSVQAAAMLQLEHWRGRDVVALMAQTFEGPGQDEGIKHEIAQADDLLLATLLGLQGGREAIAEGARQAWATYQNAVAQVLPRLLEPQSQAALTEQLSRMEQQAAAATTQLGHLDASTDPAAAAAEARRQVCSVFAPDTKAAGVDAAAAATPKTREAQARAFTALANISLARLR